MQESKLTICFNAKVQPNQIILPKKIISQLPTKSTMAEGMINSLPFRIPLETKGKGSHWLEINKAMLTAINAKTGEIVTVEITRVGEESEVREPLDLHKALTTKPLAQTSWKSITPMARRDWIFSITSAKQTETRERRIEKAVDMLSSGKRLLCCFPGIKWLMKKNEKTLGIWSPLNSKK